MKFRSPRMILLALIACSAPAREAPAPGCGTHSERASEELYLHRQAERRTTPSPAQRARARAKAAVSTNRDFGNIAVIDDADGAVATQNAFNLSQKTVAFIPTLAGATRYRIETTGNSYDAASAQAGSKLEGLGDDDAQPLALPFAFPYFGTTYRSLWVNSDGNLTFGKSDAASTDRSLGRFTGGPPRIAPLFTDLDPTSAKPLNGVRFFTDGGRAVISWQSVPLFSDSGFGVEQTFQVRLFPDGRIEFAFAFGSLTDGAVTGISPGASAGNVSLISLAGGTSSEFTGPVADRFSAISAIDIATVAQKFYATHEDAYDYLVIYNAVGLQASPSAVAYEVTVRNNRSGYGDKPVETGADYGSRRRLQSVLNLGPLYQYPADPNGRVPSRGTIGDTSLSVIGHEAGHLFLAFASVADPNNPAAKPMLGRSLAHWSFDFNSEASLLEGNRIQDLGAGTSPRFVTTATVQGYSPLDQYLMGFRAPEEVPPTFLVTGSQIPAATAPQVGVSLNGGRRDIVVNDLITAVGRRTPDSTVAQRRFRFAFILVSQAGQTPQPAQVAQVEAYRAAFEKFYADATSSRATADTTLKRAVQFSASPAAAVLLNSAAKLTLSIESPASKPISFQLATSGSLIAAPADITVPAGATQVSFAIQGVREGVDELTAVPSDDTYETASARIAVLTNVSGLSLQLVGADHITAIVGTVFPAVRVQITDVNRLPVAGVRVTAEVTTGTVETRAGITDGSGIASFLWTPAASSGTLTAAIEGAPGATATVVFAGSPVVNANGIVNAASFVPGITPGSLASIFGAGLSAGVTLTTAAPLPFGAGGVQVFVNGTPARLSYISDRQINFVVPGNLTGSRAAIEIDNAAGQFNNYSVNITPVSPGIFTSSGGEAAVLIAGTGQSTFSRPCRVGDSLEIYATGLGVNVPDVQVSIASVPATVLAVAALSQYPGLYQINVTVSPGTPSGDQPILIMADGVRSNQPVIRLQ